MTTMKTRKYRNEWKYVCGDADIISICEKLKAILPGDVHGKDGRYNIHSLYFDDYRDTCAYETDAGLGSRYKYRIRYYGDDPGLLRLERKEKLYGRCYKKSCRITGDEYRDIIDGEYAKLLYETDDPVLRQFCVCAMTRRFTPKVIIDYERTAYVEPITNIRITADRNISASGDVERFLDGEYMRTPVMQKGQHVLEVKFDYILPRHVRSIVARDNLVQTSFSKYYLGRKILNKFGAPAI